MRVLLVHNDPLAPVLEDIGEKLGGDIEVYTVRDARDAFNQFLDMEFMEGYKIVFIGFGLEGLYDTISGGLVRKFIEGGFGTKGKPLVATSYQNNFRLIKAGCNLETDMSVKSLRKILRPFVEEDSYWRIYHRQMLRAG